MNAPIHHPGLKNSEVPLASRFNLGLLDLDGVVYRSDEPVEYAAQGITQAEASGLSIMYTTNNASRYQHIVADQIASFGIKVTPDHVITSGMVAARMMQEHLPQGAKVLAIGAQHLRDELKSHHFKLVDDASEHPDAVIQAWLPQLTWEQLAQASYAIENGAQFYVTNRDLTLPRAQGIAPGNGAMINAVITATQTQPIASAGKPEPAMYDEARSLMSSDKATSVPVDECLPVGDRLDTDIEAANKGGYDSLVVLTGVSDPYQIMTAKPMLRPTYIGKDLRSLNEVHYAPKMLKKHVYQSGSVIASADNQSVYVCFKNNYVDGELNESNPEALRTMDAVRAATALAWELADEGNDITRFNLPQYDIAQIK